MPLTTELTELRTRSSTHPPAARATMHSAMIAATMSPFGTAAAALRTGLAGWSVSPLLTPFTLRP